MARASRLGQTVDELEADPRIAEGVVRFRRRIRRGEAADLADFAHEQLEPHAEARARAATDAGLPFACASGCTYCCEELVMVAAPEAATVARWLAREENREQREAFLTAFDAWREQVGDVPEKLAELTARGAFEQQQRLYIEQYERRVLCPLNRDGLCMVYPVRPLGCRSAHAVQTADYCRADHPSGRAPTRFPFDAFDRALGRGHNLMRAAHHAMGAPRGKPRSLAVAVHAALTGAPKKTVGPPGRNAPCPCGSGKKYKRCCGK